MRKTIENGSCNEDETFDAKNNNLETTKRLEKPSFDAIKGCAETSTADGVNELSGSVPCPVKKLLRLPAVLAIFPVGRSTWYEGIQSGIYPKSIRISGRTVAWDQEAIEALVRRLAKA